MIAIKKRQKLNNERLNGCALYVTLEPCSMCAGAIILSRINLVVYGTKDPKTGACGSMISLLQHEKHNHKVEVHNGVLEEECCNILKEFFKGKRLKKN